MSVVFLSIRSGADSYRLIACLQCMPFDESLRPGTHPQAKCILKFVLLMAPSVLVCCPLEVFDEMAR